MSVDDGLREFWRTLPADERQTAKFLIGALLAAVALLILFDALGWLS